MENPNSQAPDSDEDVVNSIAKISKSQMANKKKDDAELLRKEVSFTTPN
jgi:hypothetical protein